MVGIIRSPLSRLLTAAVAVGLAWSCSHLGRLGADRYGPETFERILARNGRGGLEGSGRIRVEYRSRTLDVPFSLRLTAGGVLTVEADITRTGLPFAGEARLVSDTASTRVFSDLGAYEAIAPSPEAVRGFMLSLFCGGDRLIGWLAEKGCEPGRSVVCRDIEVDLDLDETYDTVYRWELAHSASEGSFKGFLYDFDEEKMLPRIVSAIVYPHEVLISVKYEQLARTDG